MLAALETSPGRSSEVMSVNLAADKPVLLFSTRIIQRITPATKNRTAMAHFYIQ
jgi:hypothetical protein